MSYAYDVMSRAWGRLSAGMPDTETKIRFGLLMEEMHEANHRLKDAVNHDAGVRKQAAALDKALTKEAEAAVTSAVATFTCPDHRFGDRGICFTCGQPPTSRIGAQ